MSESNQFEFHPKAAENFDGRAAALIDKIKPVTFGDRPKDFPSERPIAARIEGSDLVAEPEYGNKDDRGRWVERFFSHEGNRYGLMHDAYLDLRNLSDNVSGKDWPKATLSREFVEDRLFEWCRAKFGANMDKTFTTFLTDAAVESVKSYRNIVPISLMQIERSMVAGRAKIISLKREMFDELENEAVSNGGGQYDNIIKMFTELRGKIQGLAAVEIFITGDRIFALAESLAVAEQVISFLRLYSAAAYEFDKFCPCAIKGSELAPRTEVMQLSTDGGFFYEENAYQLKFWQIVDAEAAAIEQSGWDNLVGLLSPSLTDFERKLKTAVLTYSKGLTFPDFADRLVYILSSLEGLLLKDSSEPIQQNLGDRIAFAIEKDHEKRKAIVVNLKKIYKIRSEYVHHREQNNQEEESIKAFYKYAREFMHFAIVNSKTFKAPEELIAWIDKVKYGGH